MPSRATVPTASLSSGPRATPCRRRSWSAAPIAGTLLGLMIAAPSTRAQEAAKPAPTVTEADLARLQRNASVLERELELARSQHFYLVLDPAGAELSLRLRGAELQRYAVRGLQVGHPRVSWFSRRDPDPWQGVVWSDGALDPPREEERVVVTPGEEEAGSEAKPVAIPKTAEELYTVPTRFHIRFAGGLSIEVRPHEADEALSQWARVRAWWSAKWRDVSAAMDAEERDVVRLRIVLDPTDAESLYRALPPDTELIVLPSTPPAADAVPPPGSR